MIIPKLVNLSKYTSSFYEDAAYSPVTIHWILFEI